MDAGWATLIDQPSSSTVRCTFTHPAVSTHALHPCSDKKVRMSNVLAQMSHSTPQNNKLHLTKGIFWGLFFFTSPWIPAEKPTMAPIPPPLSRYKHSPGFPEMAGPSFLRAQCCVDMGSQGTRSA